MGDHARPETRHGWSCGRAPHGVYTWGAATIACQAFSVKSCWEIFFADVTARRLSGGRVCLPGRRPACSLEDRCGVCACLADAADTFRRVGAVEGDAWMRTGLAGLTVTEVLLEPLPMPARAIAVAAIRRCWSPDLDAVYLATLLKVEMACIPCTAQIYALTEEWLILFGDRH